MAKFKSKKQQSARPQGEARRSQIVTTFGPGSMMDLVNHAVLISGLDYWSYSSQNEDPTISEPRLRDRILKLGLELKPDNAFRAPPLCKDGEGTQAAGVQVLEFPKWFVCQNPDCRRLIKSTNLETKRGRYVHHCSDGKKSECVPIRFVAACKNGHLDEFPWVSFAHKYKPSCPAPQLEFKEGVSGDFSEIVVECIACKSSQSLVKALDKKANPQCFGKRPWLGPDAHESCLEKIRLLVRTASNSYFSQVISALSIPDKSQAVYAAVEEVWDVLKAATPETLPVLRTVPKVQSAISNFTDEEVLPVIESIKNGKTMESGPLRTTEFEEFISSDPEEPGILPGKDEEFFARTHQLKEPIDNVKQVVLINKLREVRALVGFTRLEPSTPDLQGEYDLGVQSADLGLNTEWLPATEVNGEGIFIRFDEERVAEWESSPAVQKRGEELLKGYQQWSEDIPKAPPFLGVRYYMLHSLSHLLISAISLECGYAASAIRERIYCDSAQSARPMAAILLHTGSYGSEGTLGGLVEQGRHLKEHLSRAFDLGVLCSNDPVCASHTPHDDPAQRYLEGAACHGCLFISECSCERFNRFLDRALVIPTMGHNPKLSFFGKKP